MSVRSPLVPTIWAGHRFDWGTRTFIMAIVNVTPDSFSGDGTGGDVAKAVEFAVAAQEAGADIIDIGGESTRPGHRPISTAEEISRIIPTVRAIASRVTVPISIDTSKAAVAEAAIAAGASIVNDVRGFTRDPELADVAARHELPVVIMHDVAPDPHDDLVASMLGELSRRVDFAVKSGIQSDRIIIDPGFGFGKDWRQNLVLLRRLTEFEALRMPILVGMSRKSMIGHVLGTTIDHRLEGTLATTALAIAGGADIVRVHDVKENVNVARMTDSVVRGIGE